MSFTDFILQNQYEKLQLLGDRLAEINKQVEWTRFRPIISRAYDDGPQGGRPHTDDILIAKSLVLQGLYGLSDEQLEFQCNDRISFRIFLELPESIPDFSTIWKAKERLSIIGAEDAIWTELQSQLNQKGFTVTKGVMQDATIQEAKRPTGETPRQGRDRDGGYTVKANKTQYGYKLHTKVCNGYNLIREIATTKASVHDSRINLVRENDIAAYRDKGYAGTPLPKGVINYTMAKGYRGRPLTVDQKRINMALSKIRSQVERPYHVIKNCFHNSLICVTTSARVHVRNIFVAFAYNVFQLVTLARSGIAIARKN
jgi:IS5 family transposase